MNKLETTFLKRVRQVQYFSLLADEATDRGNWEQLAVNLHFVDESDEVHKDFLEFVEYEPITGEYLAEKTFCCLTSGTSKLMTSTDKVMMGTPTWLAE